MEQATNRKIIVFSSVFAVLAGTVTFFTDRSIFTFPAKSDERYALALTDYSICKAIAFIVLFAAFFVIFSMIMRHDGFGEELRAVTGCALLYLPVMIIALAVKLPAGFLTSDEYSIYNDATGLIHDTWFNYMTVYYYIVSLMVIPFRYGPIIMKVIIEFFVAGYTVYRTKSHFGKKAGMFMYILFLLYPVIAYTTSAHRLPVYFLIYLAVFVKLTFDRLEDKENTRMGVFMMLLAGAVLTQWRTEGIYLLVLVPLLMFMVYPELRSRRAAAVVIVSYLAIQYIISVPQNGAASSDLGGAANDRMKPFYAYTITNMFRNGLDTVKNADDLAAVDGYIPIDSIEKINEHYEDINYEDVLILIKDEFGGVREDAGYTEYYGFTEAVKRIFINNPDVFFRTRWGAFCYSALPYHITFSGTGVRELVSFAVSIVKSVTYNLFIPVGFALAACIYCLIKRRWFGFFVFGGLMAHWAIVFILAPASYFKYYFPVYIMSYFYMIMLLIRYICSRMHHKEPYDQRTAL